MQVFPNAKINFGLKVLRRRTDGYHDLETVFLPVKGLHDTLDINIAPAGRETSFLQTGIQVDCPPEQNLIIRTLRLMQERFAKVGEVDIRFEKNIPFGAGLGGGSADAAFTAKALNGLFGLHLTDEELEEIVSPLGADCPFFIQNRPRCATGTGNVFTEVPEAFLKQLQDKWLLLVKPDAAVSTAAAYRGITPRESRFDWNDIGSFTNDFEQSVFPLFPEIADVKRRLLQAGALHAAMSGSGATVFGLFDQPVTDAGRLFPACFCHQEQMTFNFCTPYGDFSTSL